MSQKIKEYLDDFQHSQAMFQELNHVHDHFSQPVDYFHLPDANIQPQQAIFYDYQKQIRQKQNLYQQKQSITMMTMQEVSQYLEIGKKQYIHESRQDKLQRYRLKKNHRKWSKKISYTCRQSVAQKRIRIKGRFVSKEQAENIEKQIRQLSESDKINSTFSIQQPGNKIQQKDNYKEAQQS